MIHIEPSATSTRASSVAYRNVMAEGTLWAPSETPDGFAANALGPQTYDFWTPATMPAIIAVTLVESTPCECAAIVAHTLGSNGATVAVQLRETLAGPWITVGR